MILTIVEILIFYFTYQYFGLTEAVVGLALFYVCKTYLKYCKYKVLSNADIALTLLVITIAGLTITFNSPVFLQWKLTIVYTTFALSLFISKHFAHFDICKRLFGHSSIYTSDKTWQEVNILWAIFFIANALTNTYLTLYSTIDAWVNFKTFWSTAAFLGFAILTPFYLYIRMPELEKLKLKAKK